MKAARQPWFIRRLTVIAIVVGIFATLSYGTGAHIVVRYFLPETGRWWNEQEFAFMQCAATGLGLLVAFRICSRFVDDAKVKSRVLIASVISGAIMLPPLANFCSTIARLGWNADSGNIASRLINLSGYSAASILDKILIAGVYFIKTAAFAMLFGLAIFAIALAALMMSRSHPVQPGSPVSQ
ncbi:MAG TPA: hypothetical protein VIX12_00990 [Candidatus Binataceae bacterium]